MNVLRDDSVVRRLLASPEDMAVATSQDLISPLVLIRQIAILLSNECVTDEDRELLAKRLTLTSERAIRLASSILMTAMNQSNLQLEPINPVSICREVVHELKPLFSAHNTSIELIARKKVPLLVGDRKLLQDILLGFGDNALYFCSDKQPMKMSVAVKNDFVRIAVRDFGPRISKNLWESLESNIVKHAANTLVGRTTSSGVVLLVARRLAELMGARIGVVRHQDGATFFIDLRISQQMSLV